MRLTPYVVALWPLVALAQQPSEAALARDQLLRDSAVEQQARERQIIDQHWLETASHAEAAASRLQDVCGKVESDELKKLCAEPLALGSGRRKTPETPAEMCAKVDAETRARWALCNTSSEKK